MPFPSRACKTCRLRHVKCDEAYPICRRCIKAGKQCLGFANRPDHFAFRDENDYASGLARRPRESSHNVANEHAELVSSTVVVVSRSSASFATLPGSAAQRRTRLRGSPRPISIPRSPGLSLQTYAFADFARRYIDVGTIASDGQWDHLRLYRSEWESEEERSALGIATTALAFAVFSRTNKSLAAVKMSIQKYNEATKKMQMVLLDGHQVLNDQTILAVMVLDAYEATMADLDDDMPKKQRLWHQGGAEMLLKFRKEQRNINNTQPTLVDRDIRRRLVRAGLFRARQMPDWLLDGSQFGGVGIELQLDAIYIQLVQLRHDTKRFLLGQCTLPCQHQQINNVVAEELISRAQAIDQAQAIDLSLINWFQTLPSEWSYTVHPTIDDNQPTNMNMYTSLRVAHTLDLYRAARLATNGILTALTLPTYNDSPLHASQYQSAETTIRLLADDFAASIPYYYSQHTHHYPNVTENEATSMTGRRATMLVFPLCIAMAISRIPVTQRMWFKRQILRVSRYTGSGTLKRVAGSREGQNLEGLI